MTPRGHVTAPLDRALAAEAGALLARAFLRNPGYLATLGFLDEPARLVALTKLKTAFVRGALHAQRAEAVTVDGGLAGVAIIAEPGQYPPPLSVFLRHARGAIATGPRGIRNLLTIDAAMRKKHVKEPHHYLFVLGVEPEHQGKGIGRALLDALAARASEAQLPCYLETDTEENVRFYQSAGYEVIDEVVVPKLGGVRLWAMRRGVTPLGGK